MATKSESDRNEEWRKRVFVGTLPSDFLRITASNYQSRQEQEAADAQTALALQQQLSLPHSQNIIGKLSITAVQAKLVKNYGMTRMDPYVTIRVGHCNFRTEADPSGGKHPKWDKTFCCLLPQGVNRIHINIYDECSLKGDEHIAWNDVEVPQNVLNGETCDDWFPLSGRQGERLEGMINLVISFMPYPYGTYPLTSVVMGIPSAPYGYGNTRPVPVSVAPPSYPVPAGRPTTFQLSAEDLKLVEEMFPNMDKDVVKSVFEANGGNKDLTINSLLQMSA